ncbi:LLM class flavin-dependent oxidoreductase [Micromonospora echinofusca]|uniref:Alkanesulfonate monooxygenase n=1 Tax=Micromonospora echinofusca TaxID=47858 RepID=A0A1C5G986_MICEH|nr:LLM class flavin-dependent oxidoreductase [Micromonospora echinofusca]SCG16248.1 alkanesulfonate monooxygenase [Micromonospora echinofusca]
MPDVSFITVVPRVRDLTQYSQTAMSVIRRTDAADLDGVLIFTGSGAVLDPWILATAAAAGTTRLSPLVAVNPVYQHPFTAARMVASLGLLYQRRIDLNLITGTAVSDLDALGDRLEHDDRYARLAEYVEIMMGVLGSRRPFSFDGRFYQVSRLQLTPGLPAHLLPRLFVAGQSPAAREVAARVGATSIQMLTAGRSDADGAPAGALNFGLLTRATAEETERVAAARFPEDPDGAKITAVTMANTDSVWKQRLFAEAEAGHGAVTVDPAYRLAPFRSGQADGPYLVADHVGAVERLLAMIRAGVRTFVLDTPTDDEDFHNLATVVRIVRDRLRVDPTEGER